VCIVAAVMKEGTEWDEEDLRERSFEITAFRPTAYDRRHERRRFARRRSHRSPSEAEPGGLSKTRACDGIDHASYRRHGREAEQVSTADR
jgi:hypothetical protein